MLLDLGTSTVQGLQIRLQRVCSPSRGGLASASLVALQAPSHAAHHTVGKAPQSTLHAGASKSESKGKLKSLLGSCVQVKLQPTPPARASSELIWMAQQTTAAAQHLASSVAEGLSGVGHQACMYHATAQAMRICRYHDLINTVAVTP